MSVNDNLDDNQYWFIQNFVPCPQNTKRTRTEIMIIKPPLRPVQGCVLADIGCIGKEHNGYCYFAGKKQFPLNWTESQKSCEEEGGNLISIFSKDEQNVLDDPLALLSAGVYWIGLRIFGYEGHQEWSDESPVVFTMLKDVPDNTAQEMCTSINTTDGFWYQENCDVRKPYICKKKLNLLDNSTDAPTTTPLPGGMCPLGWSAFRNKCFHIYNEKHNWDDARTVCQTANISDGNVATIRSKEEQGFLIALLGEESETFPVWIGLRMVPIEESYVWSSDSTLPDFTNWSPKSPKAAKGSDNYERCVEMSNMPLRIGKWTDIGCSEKRGYVCQGYKSTNIGPIATPTPPACTSMDGDAQSYRNDSYFWGGVPSNWRKAEEFCKTDGRMHLTSIVDAFEQAALLNYMDYCHLDKVWIGFSDTNTNKTGKFSWTDGWPTYLTNWGRGEPRTDVSERCVVLTSGMDWKVEDCSEKNQFVCKQTNGNPPEINWIDGDCPISNKWIDTGLRSCYIIENNEIADWGVALQTCQNLGGNLTSFHSQNELDLLRPHIQDSEHHLWIGMEKSFLGSYEWVDGSPDDFNPWDDGEPSPQENEQCVELYAHNLKFNNAKCTSKRGYICATDKIPKTSSSVLTESTSTVTDSTTKARPTAAPGSCPRGWIQFESYLDRIKKCYQINGANDLEKATWQGALETCRKMGPGHDLLAVNSEDEQIFLTSNMYKLKTPAWIGLKNNSTHFYWSDNSETLYENWDTSLHDSLKDPCFEMIENTVRAGQWRERNCSVKQSFICQRSPDLSGLDPNPEKEKECPRGYVPYNEACYRIAHSDAERSKWSEAEDTCRKENGHLVSVTSVYEQAFLYTQLDALITSSDGLLAKGYWIGLKDTDDKRIFQWSDKWPVYFSDWSKDEPKNSKKERCVFLDATKKDWVTSDCESQFNYICKITSEKPPVVPKIKEGTCPSHVPSSINTGGQNCYEINLRKATWGTAFTYCNHYGGVLASFHSQHEVDLLASYMKKAKGGLWIGLVRKHDGGFEWKDDTAVDYTNWADNYPTSNNMEMCVKIESSNLQWMNLACSDSSLAFVCQYKTIIVNATLDNESGISDTGVAGIVVAILLIAVATTVLSIFLYKKYRVSKEEADLIVLVPNVDMGA